MSKIILSALIISVFFTSQCLAFEQSTITHLGPKKNVKAELILPTGKGPFPAVLVLHTSGNVQEADIAFARQLAGEGFACLVPYYFDTYGIDNITRAESATKYAESTLLDFQSEIEFLKDDERIKAQKAGAVGFSMGGIGLWSWLPREKYKRGSPIMEQSQGVGGRSSFKYPIDAIFSKDSSPVLILHGNADSTVPVELATTLGPHES